MLLLALAAGISGIPPEQAAGDALMGCVKHSARMLEISPANSTALALSGLAYMAEPPETLKSMKPAPYGTGRFAGAPALEGQVFAVGYDRGTCIVMAIGSEVEPIEARLTEMFSIPGTWQAEAIEQSDPGSRRSQYGWNANGRHLMAQMRVQPLPGSVAKGMVMVTISPDSKKKK